MKASLSSVLSLENLGRGLWALALLALPVTSFRYFPFMGETTYVRPLSFYPLVLLLPVLFIQFLRDRSRLTWPGSLTPLAAFVLATAGATVIGILFAPLVLRGQAYFGRALRAWATLIVGLVFFVTAVWMNRDEADLKFTVKWLLAGFVIDLAWSGLQGATFYLHILPKPLLTHWQRAFSMRELIRTDRINGMAYEPAWLAGEIATVYLPWLLAALLTRFRLTRFTWLEPALLAGAVLLLLATFSRGGLLTVAASVGLTLLLVGGEALRGAWRWFRSGFRAGWGWLARLGIILSLLAAAAGSLWFLSRKNYIARIWNTQASSVEEFLIQNSAGARMAYIWGSLGAYRDHPWSGVGLGASGFYIYPNLPDWVQTVVPEIARQLSPDSQLYPNPKNLYVRLLAETGLIGFFLFIAFQFSMLGDAVVALQQKVAVWRYLGIASICSWLAAIFYNMTQDSLATPNLWINLGILVGISACAIKSSQFPRKSP